MSLPKVDVLELQSTEGGEASAAVRARVQRARAIQRARYEAGETSAAVNAALTPRDFDRVCALSSRTKKVLAAAVRTYGLSARAYGKILRVARTIADLGGATSVSETDVSEAVMLRVIGRETPTVKLKTNAA